MKIRQKLEVKLTNIYCEGTIKDETSVMQMKPFTMEVNASTNIYAMTSDFVEMLRANNPDKNLIAAKIDVYADYSGIKVLLDTLHCYFQEGKFAFENGKLPEAIVDNDAITNIKRQLIEFMTKYEMNHDYGIYTNDGLAYIVDSDGNAKEKEDTPGFYYADGDVSMYFENDLVGILNGYDCFSEGIREEFREIFSKNGYFCELGNSWNLSAYKI